MSRLDYHVTKVQGKMLLDRHAPAPGVVAARLRRRSSGSVILVGKLFQLYLPRQRVWFFGGLGVAVAAAVGVRVLAPPDARSRRPSRSTSGWG